MKIYEEKHKKKFQSIDQQMKEKILGLSSIRLATEEAQKLWLKETAEQNARSIQLWDKKECFLRRFQKPAMSAAHQTKRAVSEQSERES